MNEEIEKVGQEQTGTTTESPESTAAAAAFGRSRSGEFHPPEEIEVVEEKPEVVEEPLVLAGMTEKQLKELLDEIPKYRKQIDNLAGTNGKLNVAIQKLQQETAQGAHVTVTDEDMADFKEFPELGNMTKSALNKALSKINLRGTGSAQTPEEYVSLARKAAEEVATIERVKTHAELLNGLTPGWDVIVGVPDSEGNLPDTAYRRWLASKPADYQKKIGDSNNAFEIGSSIKEFNAAQAASAKKQEQNKSRLANAVQPTGQVAARSTQSEASAAEAAFKANRGR